MKISVHAAVMNYMYLSAAHTLYAVGPIVTCRDINFPI